MFYTSHESKNSISKNCKIGIKVHIKRFIICIITFFFHCHPNHFLYPVKKLIKVALMLDRLVPVFETLSTVKSEFFSEL